MMGLSLLYHTRSYPITSFADVLQWCSRNFRMVGPKMVPVVPRTTGQDERLLYQTWITQFSVQDVL